MRVVDLGEMGDARWIRALGGWGWRAAHAVDPSFRRDIARWLGAVWEHNKGKR